MEKIRVAIADDSANIRETITMSLESRDYIEVVGCAKDGMEALDLIRTTQPDVLLLDLIMPVMDGIGVLEKLSVNPVSGPQIIVLSALGHEDIIQRAMAFGIRYYMVKPFDMDLLVKRIDDLVTDSSSEPSKRQAMQRIHSGVKSLDEEITSIFLMVGIPAHIKGYHFLREAVKMVIETPPIINAITKELYPGIAKRFDTTASKVERAIRHAIEVAWVRGKIEAINQIFGYNIYNKNDKPTNGEFIALIADKLSIERSA